MHGRGDLKGIGLLSSGLRSLTNPRCFVGSQHDSAQLWRPGNQEAAETLRTRKGSRQHKVGGSTQGEEGKRGRREWLGVSTRLSSLGPQLYWGPYLGGCMKTTHTVQGGSSSLGLQIQVLIFPRNILTDTPRNSFAVVWESFIPVELTYKISHHEYWSWEMLLPILLACCLDTKCTQENSENLKVGWDSG